MGLYRGRGGPGGAYKGGGPPPGGGLNRAKRGLFGSTKGVPLVLHKIDFFHRGFGRSVWAGSQGRTPPGGSRGPFWGSRGGVPPPRGGSLGGLKWPFIGDLAGKGAKKGSK